jgi:hypothetical protein
VEAYIDTAEYGYRRIYDPNLVVERVWEYARAALDLKEGERAPRVPGRFVPPGEEVLAVLQRERGERKAGKKARERARRLVRPEAQRQMTGAHLA